jgi:phytoene dehydrogenase-like protein
MDNKVNDKSIIIIGAGFAGLSAGIYAQMNGYRTQIFEMHDKPGGLCTAWKLKGYTIDGCIHWLVGSSPDSNMHDIWEEVGITQNREFIYMDEFMRLEDSAGRSLVFYTDIDRLERHLLEFSPQDRVLIMEFTDGIRMCLTFDQPSRHMPILKRLSKQAKTIFTFIRHGKEMQKWMKVTARDFSTRFTDPLLREAFFEMWIPEFSMLFMLFTFAYLHKKSAGYPIGGSMPMSYALESKYLALGGIIHYNCKIEKIITESNKAAGIRLDNGAEYFCTRVVSAADGYSTIFRMLDGKYTGEKTREIYDKWPVFPPLIFIGIGVNRTFENEPRSISGFSFELKQPVEIGESVRNRLWVHIFNHDQTVTPAGKTTLILMIQTDYEYWKKLATDKKAYNQKKDEISKTVVGLLEQRFLGISAQVEVIDVATPMTFERYTGNWKGSFEGWLISPENSYVLMKPMSQQLPGLNNFYMCGQWVEPGGGLPPAVMSGRRLVKQLCKEDRIKFRTTGSLNIL